VAAAGSQKTIAWQSAGCALVDLFYVSSSTGVVSIAQGYPDTGFYHWTLPAGLAPATDYSIRVDCKTSSGTGAPSGPGVSVQSGLFTVGTSELLLLSPGPDLMANAGSTLRVSWKKAATVSAVDVLLKYDTGSYAVVRSGVSGSFADITLPSINSNRVSVLVQGSTSSTARDAVDGYFTVRGGTPIFTSPGSPADLLIGETTDLEWISPQGSVLVDLEFFDADPGASTWRSIAKSLPDYGKFTWFVPEFWMSGGSLRATFKNASGSVIGSATSAPINLRYTTAPGQWTSFYRLYLDITKEHLYTTDAYEYSVLGTRGWVQESTVGSILDGPGAISGVNAAPYYRLYIPSLLSHHWTSDRNEYLTLRQNPGIFSAEHIVGYILPAQAPGTVPFYRLVYLSIPYHHWTTDAYEVQVLTTQWKTWAPEGIAGYLKPPSTGTGGSAPPGAVAQSVPRAALGEGAVRLSLQTALNAASYVAGPIAPGEALVLRGTGIGSPVQQTGGRGALWARRGPLPFELAGARVYFDEVPAGILASAPGEVRVIVPEEVAGRAGVHIRVERGGGALWARSNALQLPVAQAAPGVYTADHTGRGQATALVKGRELTFYITGEGRWPEETSGVAQAFLPVCRVRIGGRDADLLSVDAAPDLPGVFALRVRLPEGLQPGSVPLSVSVGDFAAQDGVTVEVR